MIIDDLKQQAREKANIQQRLEAKNKEIKLLRDEIDQLKEDLLCRRLNLGGKAISESNELEQELIKLTQQNKGLKLEINELKHKLDDAQFKS